MLKITSYSAKGTKSDSVLPKDWEVKPNLKVLSSLVKIYEEKTHPQLAHTKTRADINRTKKKFYRQKGTGGARHGSRSAPIFVGGGVAHGPKSIKRKVSILSKIKGKLKFMGLNLKVKEGTVISLELASFKKTSEVGKVLKKIAKVGQKITFVVNEENKEIKRVLRNIKNARVLFWQNVNAYDLITGGLIVLDKSFLGSQKKQNKKTKVVQKKGK